MGFSLAFKGLKEIVSVKTWYVKFSLNTVFLFKGHCVCVCVFFNFAGNCML